MSLCAFDLDSRLGGNDGVDQLANALLNIYFTYNRANNGRAVPENGFEKQEKGARLIYPQPTIRLDSNRSPLVNLHVVN